MSLFPAILIGCVLWPSASLSEVHRIKRAALDAVDAGHFLDDDIPDYLAAPTEEKMKSYSGDWLFHVTTTSCHGMAFDNAADSWLSRVFLTCLSVACIWAVLWTAKAENEQKEGFEYAASLEEPEPEQRMHYLDFARICAVMCVIFEHSGGEDYTHRNVGFGLWWALPYLYITSGIGSMLSKKSMSGYVMRLLVVFAVGVGANFLADFVTKRDWKHDFGNTIFQMFFVVMLIIMAPLAEPLRLALRRRKDDPAARAADATTYYTAFWTVITAVSLVWFARGRSEDYLSQTFEHGEVNAWIKFYAPVLQHTPIILIHVGGSLVLALLAVMVTHPEKTGFIGWILLAFTYLQQIVIPWDQDSFAHLVCLNLFGLVVAAWPLQGTKTIAARVRSYWPFLLMFLCLDSMPDMWGRCDVHSPYSIWERFRMNLGECVLVVCFVTGSFAPDDPHKVTVWMGQWSLYAYCFHVMWYRLLGSPYGALVTFAAIPGFWLLNRRSSCEKS